jgi:hypothetical protein
VEGFEMSKQRVRLVLVLLGLSPVFGWAQESLIDMDLPEEITSTCEYSHGTGGYDCEEISFTISARKEEIDRVMLFNRSMLWTVPVELTGLDCQTERTVRFRDMADRAHSKGLPLRPGKNLLEFAVYQGGDGPMAIETFTVSLVRQTRY